MEVPADGRNEPWLSWTSSSLIIMLSQTHLECSTSSMVLVSLLSRCLMDPSVSISSLVGSQIYSTALTSATLLMTLFSTGSFCTPDRRAVRTVDSQDSRQFDSIYETQYLFLLLFISCFSIFFWQYEWLYILPIFSLPLALIHLWFLLHVQQNHCWCDPGKWHTESYHKITVTMHVTMVLTTWSTTLKFVTTYILQLIHLFIFSGYWKLIKFRVGLEDNPRKIAVLTL